MKPVKQQLKDGVVSGLLYWPRLARDLVVTPFALLYLYVSVRFDKK